jgi:hypothetical protein
MTYQSINLYQPTQEPTEPQEAYEPSIREATGTVSLTIRDGVPVVETKGVQSVSYSGISKDGDWRASARNAAGLPESHITAESIVTLGKHGESKIKSFIASGLMKEVSPGVFDVTDAVNEEAPEESDGILKEGHPDAAVMPEELVREVNNALEPFPDQVVDAAIAYAIDEAIGKMTEGEVLKLVSNMSPGMDLRELSGRKAFVWDVCQTQVDRYLSRQGIGTDDLSTFYSFALENPGAVTDAIQKQIYNKDMRGWKSIVREYMSNMAPSAEALQRAGFEVQGDKVRIDGDWIPISVAAKSGLI